MSVRVGQPPQPILYAFSSPIKSIKVLKLNRFSKLNANISNQTRCYHLDSIYRKRNVVRHASRGDTSTEESGGVRRVVQILLWTAEAVYILWLFLLPFAPVCFISYFR